MPPPPLKKGRRARHPGDREWRKRPERRRDLAGRRRRPAETKMLHDGSASARSSTEQKAAGRAGRVRAAGSPSPTSRSSSRRASPRELAARQLREQLVLRGRRGRGPSARRARSTSVDSITTATPWRRASAEHAVDVALGADVHPAGRVVEQQDLGLIASQRAITTFCWLPPLSEVIAFLRWPARIRQDLGVMLKALVGQPAPHRPRGADRRQGGQLEVLEDRA